MTLFIRRPVGTLLMALGILVAGLIAYRDLPIAPLPNVDVPTIVVFATRPGADPATMASAVAAPLERQLGTIAGVNEMSSVSAAGVATIVIQFSVSRDLDSAGFDVQAAINAAAIDLPSDLASRPFFRKFNPADVPILTLALTSDSRPLAEVQEFADTILAQRLAQVQGVSQVQVNGADTPAIRVRLDPAALAAIGLTGRDVDLALKAANTAGPTGGFDGADHAEVIRINGQLKQADEYRDLFIPLPGGRSVRLGDIASVANSTTNVRLGAWSGAHPAVLVEVEWTPEARQLNSDSSQRGERADVPERVRASQPGVHAEGR